MKKLLWLSTFLLAFPVFANWQLDKQNSVVSFTTFKKEHIAENHRFHNLNANVSAQGQVELTIDLTSVDTNIAIRDQRMKEHLFNVNSFPTAMFTAQLEQKVLQQLTSDSSQMLTLKGKIELHGQTQAVSVEVLVSKMANGFLVTSLAPLLIKAQDFELVTGINKLMELAKLPSISHTVPVSFTLSFTRE
ncbi:hypothetical protein tinsulaeT_22650 [Thalassotalea insulae]|uniref:Lipid/polyisoprenoid-binding YceI-like domain-containing protein n=1 Tax=Thalassotalea insulae TaxID=2056778 RepID=A0ABQ6GWP5_9GAMM|nr:YceI family protein [Thalassotalea insulae]GLX78925.1 hypothetical protein tinsulaeT_22650 [Thalassotalea insulae]